MLRKEPVASGTHYPASDEQRSQLQQLKFLAASSPAHLVHVSPSPYSLSASYPPLQLTMEAASRQTARLLRSSTLRNTSRLPSAIPSTQTSLNRARQRNVFTTPFRSGPDSSLLSLGSASSSGSPPTYFNNRQTLPMNTVIRFVPQQTAWIVERMGKFDRILDPGLAILVPFLDRIAYVKSLKESAIEIPSQNAITADNVTLELDGVLYTRVFDAYKARWALLVTEILGLDVC